MGRCLGPERRCCAAPTERFSALGVRALEACWRADVEVVLFSGRRQSSVFEGSRLIGSSAYIFELGCGLVIDGELEWLTDGLVPSDEHGSIFDQIEASGAPALLLERYAGRLEYHTPWSRGREVSHLFRGSIDLDEAASVLAEAGLGWLRLVDNGVVRRARRADARVADRARIPPDPGGGIEGPRRGPAHAGARLRGLRLHRCRRLA